MPAEQVVKDIRRQTRGPAQPDSPASPKIAHTAFWAHARRKLYDVHEKTRSSIAAEGLRRSGALS